MKNPSKTIINAWEWINLLSLDVCAGALAGGIMASRLLGLDPGWAYWVILPLAVWLIYTADHLIDGLRAGKNASHVRHRFHRDHAGILISVMSLTALIAAFLAFRYLDKMMIIYGLILGTMAMAYLFIVLFIRKKSSAFFPKEVLVAFFYTAGIWGPVFAVSQHTDISAKILMGLFFLLAFEDLVFLSFMESGGDNEEGQSSLAIALGSKTSKRLLLILGSTGIVSSLLIVLSDPVAIVLKATLIMLFMQACLLVIVFSSNYLRKNDLYRYLSEAVFFLPALMLL